MNRNLPSPTFSDERKFENLFSNSEAKLLAGCSEPFISYYSLHLIKVRISFVIVITTSSGGRFKML